jgi:hypothetical protein
VRLLESLLETLYLLLFGFVKAQEQWQSPRGWQGKTTAAAAAGKMGPKEVSLLKSWIAGAATAAVCTTLEVVIAAGYKVKWESIHCRVRTVAAADAVTKVCCPLVL